MNNLTQYNDFMSEGLSTVSSFLKAQYNNIFQDPNQNLNNRFVTFTKKVDTEKNVAALFKQYSIENTTLFQTEIDNAESIDAINKLLTDEIKYFYFSLKTVTIKLQNSQFTMQEIFSRSRDKRLQKLMSYPEDQFSNGVQQYMNDGVLPWVKKDAGIKENTQQQTQTQQQQQNHQQQHGTMSERIKYNILKILEADQTNTDENLNSYKISAKKWAKMTLFDLLKPKYQLLSRLGASTSTSVDQLSKQMKGTTNDNAKEIILNKIVNMNRQELQNLVKTLGLTEEEIGKL